MQLSLCLLLCSYALTVNSSLDHTTGDVLKTSDIKKYLEDASSLPERIKCFSYTGTELLILQSRATDLLRPNELRSLITQEILAGGEALDADTLDAFGKKHFLPKMDKARGGHFHFTKYLKLKVDGTLTRYESGGLNDTGTIHLIRDGLESSYRTAMNQANIEYSRSSTFIPAITDILPSLSPYRKYFDFAKGTKIDDEIIIEIPVEKSAIRVTIAANTNFIEKLEWLTSSGVPSLICWYDSPLSVSDDVTIPQILTRLNISSKPGEPSVAKAKIFVCDSMSVNPTGMADDFLMPLPAGTTVITSAYKGQKGDIRSSVLNEQVVDVIPILDQLFARPEHAIPLSTIEKDLFNSSKSNTGRVLFAINSGVILLILCIIFANFKRKRQEH